MGLIDLNHIKRLFSAKRDDPPGPEVYRELLLLVLARATDADAYTHPAEVEVVQRVLEAHLGEPIEPSDVRIAARSAIFETTPLERFIARVGPRLPRSERRKIINALMAVLRADDRVANSEAHYFNMVAAAMELSFAEVAGLTSD